MCGTYKLYTKPKLPTCVRVADWISNYFLSHLEKPTSILIMIQMKPSFMLVIWYYTDLKEPQKYEYYAKDNVEVLLGTFHWE